MLPYTTVAKITCSCCICYAVDIISVTLYAFIDNINSVVTIASSASAITDINIARIFTILTLGNI